MCIERILDRFYNLENNYHKFTKNSLATNKLGFVNNININKKRKRKISTKKNDIDKNKTIEKDNFIIKQNIKI